MTDFCFRRSSYSGGNAGQECVEVARNIPGNVAVRDSKVPSGAVLVVIPAAWDALRRGLNEHPSMSQRYGMNE